MKNAIKALSIAILLTGILSGVLLSSDSGDAGDATNDKTIEKYYSYTLEFKYTGENAVDVKWNFGDDSELTVTGFTVTHTYAKIGIYTVTQTVYGSSGITEEEKYQVEVMGPPMVTFDSDGGENVPPIYVPLKNGEAQKIENLPSPEKNWYNFDGWYLDKELTQKWNAEDTVSEHMTLYAGWSFDYLSNEMIILMMTSILSAFAILLLILVMRRSKEEEE